MPCGLFSIFLLHVVGSVHVVAQLLHNRAKVARYCRLLRMLKLHRTRRRLLMMSYIKTSGAISVYQLHTVLDKAR